MPVTRKIPPLPPPGVQIIDPETGWFTVEGYRWFSDLIAVLKEMRGLIP